MAEERFVGGDPYTDPQAQNVIDGSVDFFDFDWGDPVQHDEDALDACRRRRCRPCGSDCTCDDDDGCGTDCTCDDDCACGDNLPDQQDEQAYEIVEE